MSFPTLQNGFGQVYYTCDRDPTSTETVDDQGNTIYSNIPGFNYMWVNLTDKTYFWCSDNTYGAMVWEQISSNTNLLSMILNAGWKINSNRPYVSRSSPAFGTSYTPSSTNDTFVTATVNIILSLLQSSTIQAQVDTGPGFVTVAIAAPGGVAINDTRTLNFIVPAGASYKIISSGTGTNTLNSLMELSL